jgi:hypothetical protein
MAKRIALIFLGTAPLIVLVLFFVDLRALSWLFTILVMGFPIALVALGVSRNGRMGRVAWPLLVLTAMLLLGGLGVVFFNGSKISGPSGFPLSLHILLVLLWLGPLLLTTLTYAATFSDLGIDDALLARLEGMRRERQRGNLP